MAPNTRTEGPISMDSVKQLYDGASIDTASVPFPIYSRDEFTTPAFPFQDMSVPSPLNWSMGSPEYPISGPDISSGGSLTIFGFLVTFSIFTIFGNSLVMLAVSKEHYLKSPPNYFIASLAAADFSVGVLLMPFEAISQLLNRRWIFGEIFCDLWHSFDVLLTTASILNLCVISLDRYWAICTPLHYSRRMTSKRAFRFIALVWICSFMISLPAIFWWRSMRDGPLPYQTCLMTDDVTYLLSSSCISFYIPLSVMLFAYYKIYLAAIKQSKSIQLGTKHLSLNDKASDITLRMHRGGSNGMASSASSVVTSNGTDPMAHRKSFSFGRSSDSSGIALLNESKRTSSEKIIKTNGMIRRSSILKRSGSNRRNGKRTLSDSMIQTEESSTSTGSTGLITGDSIMEDEPETGIARLITDPLVIIHNVTQNTNSPGGSPTPRKYFRRASNNLLIPAMSFRRQSRRSFTVARKLAKFAKEKKAAKTLAIVLGVFIICWLPFFVINIVFALCKSCAQGQMVIFEVATWLGWINSAMNPVIYACWSHDFRRAFGRLLCCSRSRCGGSDPEWRSQRRLSCV